MDCENTTPSCDTYLTAVVQGRPGSHWDDKDVLVHYQNTDGHLCELILGSNAKLTDAHRPLQIPSPLATVNLYKLFPSPPVAVPFGKNDQCRIIQATGTSIDPLPNIQAAPGSKFSALSPDNLRVYFHFQVDGDESSIFEARRDDLPEFRDGKSDVVADNAQPLQPIASTPGEGLVCPTRVIEGLRGKLLAKNPNSKVQLGESRRLVYHGTDGFLYLSFIYQTPLGPEYWADKIDSVQPECILNGSSLALVVVDNRPAVYYLDAAGSINRTILTRGCWEKPTLLSCDSNPRFGTHLAAVPFPPWGDFLHFNVTVVYQDENNNIQSVIDRVVFDAGFEK